MRTIPTYEAARLIQILASVNGTAIDNDEGKPGEYLANVCHQAAERLHEFHATLELIEIVYGVHVLKNVADRPARTEEFGSDEVGC